ncbi:hypothetical protein FBEOM_10893 [Fusarium beomiforme]|uniref:Centromere protein H C-terminal domain-containing protein n=1 Tax=Fusarium beomiforme TaxID=44412 RepID=A0A9P5ABK3_9HYPO|nr:hypothetical protein FBEOM_10893 [Fusarium beomiforme]
MSDSDDVPMMEGHEEMVHLPISDEEARILELYDRIQELRLEIAIINAQKSYQPDEASSFSAEGTQKVQTELMESRAKYLLRNDVTEAVMTANPILKAAHNGEAASLMERELLPYVERRDDTSILVAKQAAETSKVLGALTTAQSNTLRKSRENVSSAAELLELAEQVKLKKRVPPNFKTMQEQEKLEADLKASRQRWRVMKGVASGIIVGSGIDWVRDDELQNAVLDPEEE